MPDGPHCDSRSHDRESGANVESAFFAVSTQKSIGRVVMVENNPEYYERILKL